MGIDITTLVRPHLLNLQPYASARSEFSGEAQAWLDANENAYGTPGRSIETAFHRYPDPYQIALKQRISEIKNVPIDHIFLGNGSDEAIDLLIKVFCRPGVDNIVSLPPTFGMYEVAASINDVKVRSASLTADYQIDRATVESSIDENTKIIFFCSPNNPTGNLLAADDILYFLENFSGLVVVDEAYVDFSEHESWLAKLKQFPNLVVTQTLSKAFGMAGIRLGICYASEEIIGILNKIKPPYNVNELTQQKALSRVSDRASVSSEVTRILEERATLLNALGKVDFVKKIYPTDANFILVKVDNAEKRYQQLLDLNFVVRNRSSQPLCENTLRFTVGTSEENRKLIATLNTMV